MTDNEELEILKHVAEITGGKLLDRYITKIMYYTIHNKQYYGVIDIEVRDFKIVKTHIIYDYIPRVWIWKTEYTPIDCKNYTFMDPIQINIMEPDAFEQVKSITNSI